MNPAPCPTKATLRKRRRQPFPHRDLRELQALGPEALAAFLEMAWRPAEQREAA